jgi:hypothetical protein
MRMMLAEDFIENDTAKAAAALFFIVATGHFSEFLTIVKDMDDLTYWPICWNELIDCLTDLLNIDCITESVFYGDGAKERLAALHRKLMGVDHV